MIFFQQFLKGSECLWEKLCEQHNFKGSERNENETWRELHQVYNVNDTLFLTLWTLRQFKVGEFTSET